MIRYLLGRVTKPTALTLTPAVRLASGADRGRRGESELQKRVRMIDRIERNERREAHQRQHGRTSRPYRRTSKVQQDIENAEKRLDRSVGNIMRSNVPSPTILDTSFFYRPRKQFESAISNRLIQLEAMYPLELSGLLNFMHKFSTQQSHRFRIESQLNRLTYHSDQNFLGGASIDTLYRLIEEQLCLKETEDITLQQVNYFVKCGFGDLALRAIKKNKYFKVMTSNFVMVLLRWIVDEKVQSSAIELLRLVPRVVSHGRKIMMDQDILAYLLVYNEFDCMSKLEYQYRLANLFLPDAVANSLDILNFINNVFVLSFREDEYSRKKFSSSLEALLRVDYRGNEKFLYFIAEVLFSSPTYYQGVHNVMLTVALLSRIATNNCKIPISPILNTLSMNLANFHFLFEKNLPELLNQIRLKQVYQAGYQEFSIGANIGNRNTFTYLDEYLINREVFDGGKKVKPDSFVPQNVEDEDFEIEEGQAVNSVLQEYNEKLAGTKSNDELAKTMQEFESKFYAELMKLKENNSLEYDKFIKAHRIGRQQIQKMKKSYEVQHDPKITNKLEPAVNNYLQSIQTMARKQSYGEQDSSTRLMNAVLSDNYTQFLGYFQNSFRYDTQRYTEFQNVKKELLKSEELAKILSKLTTDFDKEQMSSLYVLYKTQSMYDKMMFSPNLRHFFTKVFDMKSRQDKREAERAAKFSAYNLNQTIASAREPEPVKASELDELNSERIIEDPLIEEVLEGGEVVSEEPPAEQPQAEEAQQHTEEVVNQPKSQQGQKNKKLNQNPKSSFSTVKRFFSKFNKFDQQETNQDKKGDGLQNYLKKLKEVDVAVVEAEKKAKQDNWIKKSEHQPSKPKQVAEKEVPKPYKKTTQKIELPAEMLKLPADQQAAEFITNLTTCANFNEAKAALYESLAAHPDPAFLDSLQKLSSIRFFNNGRQLLMGVFFYGITAARPGVEAHPDKLIANFECTIGHIQKDYSKYLNPATTPFNFALSNNSYSILLADLQRGYFRAGMKKLLAHLAFYTKSIEDPLMKTICEVCDRERSGLTLLEFFNLLAKNQVEITEKAFGYFSNAIKNYKGISEDIFTLYKHFVNKYKWNPNPQIFDAYVDNLVKDKQNEKIAKLVKDIKELLVPKKYKFDSALSNVENKQKENELKEQFRLQSIELLRQLVSLCARFDDVVNAEPLFEEYLAGESNIKPEDLELAYLSYANNEQKFKKILDRQASVPITDKQFQSVVSAFERHPRTLSQHIEQMVSHFIYSRKLKLNNKQISRIANIFRRSDNALTFSRFLEHLLRTCDEISHEHRRPFFKILNQARDEASKTYMKGMLDMMFDKEKKDEKVKFRKTWEAEQLKKAKLEELMSENKKKMTEQGNLLEEPKKDQKDHKDQKDQKEAKEVVPAAKKEGKKKDKQDKEKQGKDQKSDKKATEVVKTEPTKQESARSISEPKKKSEGKPMIKGKSAPKIVQQEPKAQDAKDGEKVKGVKGSKKKKAEQAKKEVKTKSQSSEKHKQRQIVDLNLKKRFARNQIRHGGRDKFFDFAMTEDQMEQEEAALKQKGNKKY